MGTNRLRAAADSSKSRAKGWTPALCATAAVLCLLMSSFPADAFDLQGHRGARGLMPENTLAGFARA